MCLQNPNKKMSKSGNEKDYIGLLDAQEQIKTKIMSAVTDRDKKIRYVPDTKPGISNLLTIYSGFSKKPIQAIEKEFSGKGYAEFKKSLVKLLIDSLQPFRSAQEEISKKEIKTILNDGSKRARKIAQATMLQARKNMGLTR